MRRTLRAVATAAAVVMASVVPAAADCPAPSITAPASVVAGQDLHVEGEFFAAECNDTSSGCKGPRRSPPMRDVTVELQRQGGEILTGLEVDADESFTFAVELPVPNTAAAGTYHVVVDQKGDPGVLATAEVRVTVP